jgi:phosphate transport system substrate-binding protein
MSLGLVGHDLKGLKVDGAEPTAEQVIQKKYPLVRPFLFVTKGEPGADAKAFIDYVLSPTGQALMVKEGLVQVQ